MKRRIFIVLALVTVLALLAAGPATAKTTRTPFTGSSYILGEGWPPGRFWVPGNAALFWRDRTFYLHLETDEPRVGGLVCANHNGNYWPSPDDLMYGVQGQMWGTIHIESDSDDDCTNSVNYWEGTFVGDRDRYGNETMRYVLRGYGEYAGLQLRMEEYAGTYDWWFTVTGELLDPGGD